MVLWDIEAHHFLGQKLLDFVCDYFGLISSPLKMSEVVLGIQ